MNRFQLFTIGLLIAPAIAAVPPLVSASGNERIDLTTKAEQPFLPGKTLREAHEALENREYTRAERLATEVTNRSQNNLTRIEAHALLSQATRATGNFRACELNYIQTLAIFDNDSTLQFKDSGTLSDEYTNTLFNYAQFLQSMGRYGETAKFFGQFNFEPGSEGAARRAGMLAANKYREGERTEAIDIINSALSDYSSGPSYATLLQNRGYMLDGAGHHDEAFNDLAKAASMMTGKQRAVTGANAAMALSHSGCHKEALGLIDAAIDSLRACVGETDADYIIALRKKGEILNASGQKIEAAVVMRDFLERERKRLAVLLPTLSPQMRTDYWTKEKPLLSRCFVIGETDPELMMDVALTRRETSLLGNNFNSQSVERLTEKATDLRRRLGRDEAAVAFIRYADAKEVMRYAAVILSAAGETRFVKLFDEDFIHKPLPEGPYTLYDAVTGEDPAAKNRIYRDSTLGDKIWQPIITALPPATKTIYFAPEGIMHMWGIENMPFTGKENFTLTRQFSLLDIGDRKSPVVGKTLVAGGLDYNDTDNLEHSEGQPDHSAYTELKRSLAGVPGTQIFSYLPGTAAESESIAGLIGDAELNRSLTEDEMKRTAGNFRIIHLATHGYALDSSLSLDSRLDTDSVGVDMTLLRSGIALTGANRLGEEDAAQDGILSAREIYDLDLRGVELVVLSACQTAKGTISDESASGLIRALKNAGVKSIVASLWEVDDTATALFMQAFHKATQNGETPQQAITSARSAVSGMTGTVPTRKFSAASMASRPTGEARTNTPYDAPWFWAPFILIN